MPLKRKQMKIKSGSGKQKLKPVPSLHWRDLKRPVPANRMAARVSHAGWQCKNDECRRVIAIATTTSRNIAVILQEADGHIASAIAMPLDRLVLGSQIARATDAPMVRLPTLQPSPYWTRPQRRLAPRARVAAT
jgi:hypothetical protein